MCITQTYSTECSGLSEVPCRKWMSSLMVLQCMESSWYCSQPLHVQLNSWICRVGPQPALPVNEEHHQRGEILQKQCCCPSSPEGFITYLSLLLLFIIPINLMVDLPQTPYSHPPAIQHPKPSFLPISFPKFHPPFHGFLKAIHPSTIFPNSILLPTYWLTSQNPTFSPTIHLGSNSHSPSYISVPLELFEKFCTLPLVFYE